MHRLKQIQNNARALTPQKISNDLFSFIRTLEGELAAYNRATLFEDSQDIHGRPIGFYSYATELITGGRKAKGQPFDLKETGEFLEDIFTRVERESVFFGTKSPYLFEVLSNLLTDDIFGLQDDDLNKVITARILPFFRSYLLKNILK